MRNGDNISIFCVVNLSVGWRIHLQGLMDAVAIVVLAVGFLDTV
ncbi:MAG: hypothetical protein VCD00_00475 [Candidatus Hydrogenedentota bacterium]